MSLDVRRGVEMVPIKPYTVSVRPTLQQQGANGVFTNQFSGDSSSVTCYFEELTPGDAFNRYGVELKQPANIQCEVADAVHFAAEAEVTVRGRVYRVVGNPEIHDAGNIADHADILLEFKQYPLS